MRLLTIVRALLVHARRRPISACKAAAALATGDYFQAPCIVLEHDPETGLATRIVSGFIAGDKVKFTEESRDDLGLRDAVMTVHEVGRPPDPEAHGDFALVSFDDDRDGHLVWWKLSLFEPYRQA